MKKQRAKYICMLLPTSSPNGYGILAKALIKQGFNVTIIVLTKNSIRQIEKLKGINIISIDTRGILYSPVKALLNPLAVLMITAKALRTEAGVIWGRGYAILPCMLILKLINKRVIYHIGDDDITNMMEAVKKYCHLKHFLFAFRIVLQCFEYLLIKKADYTITLTESLKIDREKYTKNIQAVYYAVPTISSTHLISKTLKTKLQNKIVIVYSGTIALQKGFLEIIRAYEIIKRRIPDSALLFVGGILPIDLNTINAQLNRKKGIYVTGWLPYHKMTSYINLGDIGLSIINPINYSYKISLPFKLIEQMACGLPIIAPSGFPEIERVIKEANCGYLVDHQNPEEFASAVINLATNKDKRKLLGRNATQYIEEKHNIVGFESHINDIFHQVLND